jgi:succinyl-CoA synthetase beta subunit
MPENLPEVYVERLGFQGIAALSGFEEAMTAAEIAADIGGYWQQTSAAPLLAVAASKRSTEVLDEASAKVWLAEDEVPTPHGKVISSLEEAIAAAEQLSYPVVLKALGIAHKTEHGAVRLNLKNTDELTEAYQQLESMGTGLYLEHMVQGAVAELLVGFHRDERFGLVMTLGLGGIWVELFRDSQTLLLPSTAADVRQALLHLKGAALLKGYRGKQSADLAAAVNAIMRIQTFVISRANSIHELDINPLIVCASGQGAYAADALISRYIGEESAHG